MIRIEGLSKTYGARARAVTALRDVSLSLEPGVWGVVGPNGAGKTTLLGLLLGFLHPTAGSIRIADRSPRRYLRRNGAGYLPERFRLPGPWSVRAALEALARLEGHSRAGAREAARSQIDRMGLTDFSDRTVGSLSRGLLQRVGLAQALLTDHALVVLDEPTEGLDPLWRVRFREIIDDLRGRQATVLLASHDLTEVERLADHVIILDDGRVTEVIEARVPASGPLRYRITVDATTDSLRSAFPAAAPTGTAGPRALVVQVADPGELSHRLAALLAAGAALHSVVPLDDDLESRVRHRLEEP